MLDGKWILETSLLSPGSSLCFLLDEPNWKTETKETPVILFLRPTIVIILSTWSPGPGEQMDLGPMYSKTQIAEISSSWLMSVWHRLSIC